MTETEWLASDDFGEMYLRVVRTLEFSRRRTDLYCVACAKLFLPLITDEGARQAFEWLEANPGQRVRPRGGHIRDLFPGPGRPLYDAHHRREQSPNGAAVHVVYDFWADWYEYAFPNVDDYFISGPYRGALGEDPRVSLPAITRDIFGNPFRPDTFSSTWRTDTALSLARGMYDSRDFSAMPILADALQDAGCDNADILSHCRTEVTHVRGCWVVDLVLGKE